MGMEIEALPLAQALAIAVSKLHNLIASWDTKFDSGTKTALRQPFSPVVIAADEGEQIRVSNYEEATLLNSFNNHEYLDKDLSNLCLVNEFDDSLLYTYMERLPLKGKQKLVTAFSSVQGHRPGVGSVNAVVDWQQQTGYLFVECFWCDIVDNGLGFG